MQLFGLTIARTKTLEAQTKSALASVGVSGSRGWWPLIRESFTGAWQRNEELHAETVLCNPTLFACITLIAGDIAKLRLKLVEQDDDGVWTETTSAAFSPVLQKPNHYQDRIDFYEWWMVSKLAHGNTYVLKGRDGRGVVSSMYILDPHRVKPLVAPDGSVFYGLYQDELAPQTRQEPGMVVPAREIIHDVMCPLFHPLCGVSPIYAAGFSALQGLNIRRQSDKFFQNGSRPGGVLTAPGDIDKGTAERIKAYWETEFSGDNVGKIAVLANGMKYEGMAVTARDSQLAEQLRMTDEDIAKCHHMPRHKVGIGPDPTYNNIEALNIQYYADCLQKHIEKLELKLDYGIELVNVPGRTLGVEFERDDLAQMDSASLIESEKNADGIKTVNESRKRLGLKKVRGGDTVYRQQQDFSIDALNRRDSQEPAPSTLPSSQQRALPQGQDEEDDQKGMKRKALAQDFRAELRRLVAA
jgi:HK97 family phage portal protein